jgi:hypothetical protein
VDFAHLSKPFCEEVKDSYLNRGRSCSQQSLTTAGRDSSSARRILAEEEYQVHPLERFSTTTTPTPVLMATATPLHSQRPRALIVRHPELQNPCSFRRLHAGEDVLEQENK